MFISIQQIKAARALLDWNQEDLAERAHIDVNRVRGYESGRSKPQAVLEAIYSAFTAQGIAFMPEGVMKRQYEIRTLRGQQGFWDFYDDIYNTVKEQGGDIFVHNVDESLFLKWLGNKRHVHDDRMSKLTNFRQRIIIRDGDSNFAAHFATTQYRWAPKEEFTITPFYVYGHKLAIILFKPDDVAVFVLDQPEITDSYKILFQAAWDRARIPAVDKA